ncbi:MAG: sugar phosphate isomerase/epimerase family protein [Thermoproteota archaeon]
MGIKNIELNEACAKNAERVLQLFNDVKNQGGNIVVLTLEFNLLGGDVRRDEKYFNKIKNWIRICGENGCRVLRLKAVPDNSGKYSEEDFKLLYRNLLNIISSVERNNVKISIDMGVVAHSGMDRLMAMIEDMGSEMVGMTLDMNIAKMLEEQGILGRIVPLINHVSINEECLKGPERDTLKKTLDALRASAYMGYVSLELKEAKNVEEIGDYMNALKEAIGL